MKITTIFISCAALITAQTKPIVSNDIPPVSQAEKDEATQILFGERGILTGIFRMMDQQRKIQPAPQHDAAADSGKIGNFDFKKVIDTLLMGASSKGELGDHGAELPEQFLGICNRLSCGDIYKAIDKFRKSEMFSNFQTALTLVNDPNGWETIGKLLSNPELISQFTAGTGMEELFGSALGEVKKESNLTRSKNSKLMPEDGDFGIDFSEDGEGETVAKAVDKAPEIEFSVDKKSGSEDYYSEVSQVGDASEEYETLDQTPPPSSKIVKSTDNLSSPKPTVALKPDFSETMPPISFSIDGGEDDEKETETIVTAELPPTNPKILKRIHAGSNVDIRKGETGSTTITRISFASTSPTTTYPRFQSTTQTPTLPTRRYTTASTTTAARTTRTTTTPRPTTTVRNYRKDSDYYVMYYDDGDKL